MAKGNSTIYAFDYRDKDSACATAMLAWQQGDGFAAFLANDVARTERCLANDDALSSLRVCSIGQNEEEEEEERAFVEQVDGIVEVPCYARLDDGVQIELLRPAACTGDTGVMQQASEWAYCAESCAVVFTCSRRMMWWEWLLLVLFLLVATAVAVCCLGPRLRRCWRRRRERRAAAAAGPRVAGGLGPLDRSPFFGTRTQDGVTALDLGLGAYREREIAWRQQLVDHYDATGGDKAAAVRYRAEIAELRAGRDPLSVATSDSDSEEETTAEETRTEGETTDEETTETTALSE